MHLINWKNFDPRDPQSVKKLYGAFTAVLSAPDRNAMVRTAMQHFTLKGNFPAEVLPVLERLVLTEPIDLGYEQIFKIRDFTGGPVPGGWKIGLVDSGITFKAVKPGEKARVFPVAGDSITVEFDAYGAALGWDRKIIDDGQWYLLEDSALQLRSSYYLERAQIAYGLINAVTSGQNTAWQVPSPSALPTTDSRYTMSRDAQTIKIARVSVLVDCKRYGVTPQSPFVILTPVELESRVRDALAYTDTMAGNRRTVDGAFNVVVTSNLPVSTSYFVIAPFGENQFGYRQDLTVEGDTDILSYSQTVAGWGRYGGAVGNPKRIRRCAVS